jgi:hypothetical protein
VGRGSFSDGSRWRLHVQQFPEELNCWLEQLYDADAEGLPDKMRADLRAGLEAGSGINWNEKALGPDESIRARFGVQYGTAHVVTGQVERGACTIRVELDTGQVVEAALLHAPEWPADFFVVDAPYPRWIVQVEALGEGGQRVAATDRWQPTEFNRRMRDKRARRIDGR